MFQHVGLTVATVTAKGTAKGKTQAVEERKVVRVTAVRGRQMFQKRFGLVEQSGAELASERVGFLVADIRDGGFCKKK